MSNNDKRTDELKSHRKDFLWLNIYFKIKIQSSGIETAQLKALLKELIKHTNLWVWIELEQKKAMWVTKQVYKQRNENGDNQLLEKLFVLFVQDWKLNAIDDNNLFWKVEN